MDYRALLTPNVVGSFPEETDYLYEPISGQLAPAIDLIPDVHEVDNQLNVGSCTGKATTTQAEILLKHDGRPLSLSALQNYYCSRYLIMEQPGIEGATLRAAIRAGKHMGIASEALWPYDPAKVNVAPSPEAVADALTRRIQRYEMIDARITPYPPIGDLTQEEWTELCFSIASARIVGAVKSALNEGLPVSFSCLLGQMWFDLTGPWREHVYPVVTTPGNPNVGGHAMVAIGYDDACGRMLIQNSWGPAWGDGGFGGMPYDSFGRGLLEAFVVRGLDGIYRNDPLQAEFDWIQRLYLGFYGRPADLGGCLYWRDRLIADGFGAIVEAFMTSPEAAALYSPERMKEANRATRKG